MQDSSAQNTESAYETAVIALGIPTELDGELDTGWEYYHLLSTTCDTTQPYVCELFKRSRNDIYLSEVLAQNVGSKLDGLVINGKSGATLEHLMDLIGDGNDVWLEEVMSSITWFAIDEFGRDADKAAFFILQHSSNIKLQKRAAILLETLAKDGQSDPKNAGFLRDRISIKVNSPQVYGTQGRCVGEGVWQPFELVDPANVEMRRGEIGLPTLDEYQYGMSQKYC